jgi:hypothetical protein
LTDSEAWAGHDSGQWSGHCPFGPRCQENIKDDNGQSYEDNAAKRWCHEMRMSDDRKMETRRCTVNVIWYNLEYIYSIVIVNGLPRVATYYAVYI